MAVQQILNDILTWYFGLTTTGDSSTLDRYWRLEAAWNWQTWPFILLMVVILVAAVALLKMNVRQRSSKLFVLLLAVRISALFLMLLIVLQVHLETRVYAKPQLIILIDSSGSMSLQDSYSKKEQERFDKSGIAQATDSRIEIVKKELSSPDAAWLKKIEENYQVQFFTFDSKLNMTLSEQGTDESSTNRNNQSLAIAAIDANGLSTDFETSLGELSRQLSDQPPVAVILFSDGRPTAHSTTTVKQLANQLKRRQLPIHAVGIGVPSNPIDIALNEVKVEPVGFAGDDHPLAVSITANETITGPVQLTASDPESGEVLSQVFIENLSDQQITQSEIVIPNLAAQRNEYRIEVASSVGENNLQNNRQIVRVWGYDAKLKVLLVEQEPRWEFRHLKTALERDNNLIVHTFLFEGDAAYAVEDRTALSQLPDNFEEYDAVILGDINFSLLPDQADDGLEEFVKNQGGILLLSGERSLQSIDLTSLLSDLHPATIRSSVAPLQHVSTNVQLTAEGQAQRLFSPLPTGESIVPLPVLYPLEFDLLVKPAALTLLEGKPAEPSTRTVPLVLSMRYSGGIVNQHLVEDIWRWRVIDGGVFFQKFWRQTIRSICRQKLAEQLPGVDFSTNRDRYRSSESVELILIDRENHFQSTESIPAIWRLNAQLSGEVTLQRSATESARFSATLNNLASGDHTVTLPPAYGLESSIGVRFSVTAANTETDYEPLDVTFLKELSSRTDGKFYFHWELSELPDSLPDAQFPGTSETLIIPIWNRWELLTLLVSLFAFEWVLRRRQGLD